MRRRVGLLAVAAVLALLGFVLAGAVAHGALSHQSAPKVLSETVGADTIESDEITICVSDPTPVEIEIQTEAETIIRTFGVRWVPPREDGHVAFACIERGISMELDFEALEEPTVSFGLGCRVKAPALSPQCGRGRPREA